MQLVSLQELLVGRRKLSLRLSRDVTFALSDQTRQARLKIRLLGRRKFGPKFFFDIIWRLCCYLGHFKKLLKQPLGGGNYD